MALFGSDHLILNLIDQVGSKETKSGKSPTRGPNRSAVNLDIPDIIPENRTALYNSAKEFVESTKIGEFQKYRAPLSRQISSDFRTLYPVLVPFFDEAERARNNTKWSGIRMRIVTMILFSSYAIAIDFALQINIRNDISDPKWDPLLFAPLAFAFISYLIRLVGISKIKEIAGGFGSDFNRNLILIHSKATYALDNVAGDEPTTDGCDERAEQWTSVALWLFELRDRYDRFVTMASWRVQTFFFIFSWFLRGVKWLIVLAVVLHLSPHFQEITETRYTVIPLLLYVSIPLLAWDVAPGGGASNDIFAKSFIRSVSGRSKEEVFRNHLNTKIARLVKQLRDLYYNAVKVK